MADKSLGSSPSLHSPYTYGNFSPQLDRQGSSPEPLSTPSLSRGLGRRPLSNISSASESCCSACCQDGKDGVGDEHDHRQDHHTHATTDGDADVDTDERPRDKNA